MKIFVDVNLSPLWIPFLETCGIEAIHWSVLGHSAAPDREIFDHAAREGYVVFTHDLDFGAMLAKRRTRRPSVVQIRCQDVLPDAIGELVVRALVAVQFHLEDGALVTIDTAKHRVRILPF